MIDLIMIQRIQTVYLFLSALFTALLLLPLGRQVTVPGGPVRATLWGWTDPASADSLSSGAVHWISLSVPCSALALVTIFGFRNRPLQKLCVVQVVLLLVVCGLLGWCRQLCCSAFRMEPFRRLGLSRRIADPDTAGYARDFQGRAAQLPARPDSVISKRAPDRFSSRLCLSAIFLRPEGRDRSGLCCLGTGAAMRSGLS